MFDSLQLLQASHNKLAVLCLNFFAILGYDVDAGPPAFKINDLPFELEA